MYFDVPKQSSRIALALSISKEIVQLPTIAVYGCFIHRIRLAAMKLHNVERLGKSDPFIQFSLSQVCSL